MRTALSLPAIGLASLLACACASNAKPVATSAVAPPAADAARSSGSAADPDQVVCRSHNVTGTRLRSAFICKTRGAWLEEAQKTKDAMLDLERQRTIQLGGSNN